MKKLSELETIWECDAVLKDDLRAWAIEHIKGLDKLFSENKINKEIYDWVREYWMLMFELKESDLK